MATFQITGPDGKKYRVSGENAEGALQALQSHLGTAQAAPQAQQFATRAASLDPTDISIARSKNDEFGNYLRSQAMQPKSGEDIAARDARLYGKPMAGPSKLASGVAGAADMLGMGFGDEIAAGLQSATGPETYDQALRDMRKAQGVLQSENPKSYLAGQVAGGVSQGILAGAGGLTASRFVPATASGGSGLAMRMGAGAADGLAQGAIYGFGSGEGGSIDRVKSAAVNGGLGLALGGAAPALVSGVRAAGQRLGIGSVGSARDSIAAILKRSGMSIDDLSKKMDEANSLGYGDEYIAADALGRSGRNQLGALTRSTSQAGDDAQRLLDARMSAAPRRMVSALDEAGGVDGKTANIIRKELKAERGMLAADQYGAARDASGAIDVSGAIGKADEFLTPGVNNIVSPQSGIADDSVEAAMRKARSYLTDGKSTLTDFDSVMRAKTEIQNMADAAKPGSDKARRLVDMVRSLDDSLSSASAPYAKARDTYKSFSRAGEAVDTGASAATRGRYADTIQAFNSGDDLAKMGQRAGYFDNLAGTVENNPSRVGGIIREMSSPQSARQQEILAMSGQNGQKLLDRARLENEMLDTYSATKGSPTAVNQAEDAAMLSGGSVRDFATGNIGNLIRRGLDFAVDRATGQTTKSRELVAQMLMGKGTQGADQIYKAIAKNVGGKKKADMLIRSLLVGSSIPAAQLGKPNP